MSKRNIDIVIRAKDEASNSIKDVSSVLSGLSKALKASAAVGVALKLAGPINDAIKAAAAINDLAQKTAISASALSAWDYAANMTGASLEGMTTAAKFVQRALADAAGDGASPAAEAFRNLHINVDEFIKMKPEIVFEKILDAVSGIESPIIRMQYYMALMGRGGDDMNRLASSLKQLKDEASSLGFVVSDEMAASLDKADDAMTRLKESASSLWKVIAAAVSPALTDFANSATWEINKTRNAIRLLIGDVDSFSSSRAYVFGEPYPSPPLFPGMRPNPPPLQGGSREPKAPSTTEPVYPYGLDVSAPFVGEHPTAYKFYEEAIGPARDLAEESERIRKELEESATKSKELAQNLSDAKSVAINTVISSALSIMGELGASNQRWYRELIRIYNIYRAIANIVAAIRVVNAASSAVNIASGATSAAAGGSKMYTVTTSTDLAQYSSKALVSGSGGAQQIFTFNIGRPVSRLDGLILGRAAMEAANEAKRSYI